MTTAAGTPDSRCDVLVVGGGPAGSAAAIVLAREGHDVIVVERERVPRPKVCGDALSPRALAELDLLGHDHRSIPGHRVDRIRIVARGSAIERPWPDHPGLPDHGLVVSRQVLDEHLIGLAAAAGATVRDGHDAVSPIVERGFVGGAIVDTLDGARRQIAARYTIVADGANSRFGRAVGTHRERTWPYAAAIRGYWASPGHDDPVVEAHLDLVGTDGRSLTGYGWVFPTGTGRVNIGVGVVSTSDEFRSVNTGHLLSAFAEALAERWNLDAASPLGAPASGRIPLGGSVGPSAGPAHLVVGDAAGLANPLTGAGIEYALASGRIAGDILATAISRADPTGLQHYPDRLRNETATYFKVGRLLDRFAGRPAVMEHFSRRVTASEVAADVAIRIGTGALRHRKPGPAELLYRAARTASRIAPDS